MKLRTVSMALAFSGILCAFAPRPVRAALSDSVMTWFKNWKQGLEKTAVEGQRRRVRTTSVAAVRGENQAEDVTKPYWKGRVSDKKAADSMAERKELSAAVDLALAGKKDEALKKLEAFEKAHPQSAYLQDVAQAKEKLAPAQ